MFFLMLVLLEANHPSPTRIFLAPSARPLVQHNKRIILSHISPPCLSPVAQKSHKLLGISLHLPSDSTGSQAAEPSNPITEDGSAGPMTAGGNSEEGPRASGSHETQDDNRRAAIVEPIPFMASLRNNSFYQCMLICIII